MRTGIANFTLDYGKCPRWLFERMVKLARIITIAIVQEFGSQEFLKRLSDPVWFQSFGCVLAFDWNASGLTTTTLGALKVALGDIQKDIDVFVCGGKGKTSRKTPEEIQNWSLNLGLGQNLASQLVYASKAIAKVDSALIQDGFEIYQHNFLFNKKGDFTVIQQGMNTKLVKARRYHWHGQAPFSKFLNDPHQGIASQAFLPSILDLAATKSGQNRQVAVELAQSPKDLKKDIEILIEKMNPTISLFKIKKGRDELKIMNLTDNDFHSPQILGLNFNSQRLRQNIQSVSLAKPGSFQELFMLKNIGGKTLRAISLVAEIIYGAKPSYQDPARYSFAHGGKDAIPFAVDRKIYDKTIDLMQKAVNFAPLTLKEKTAAKARVEKQFGGLVY